MANDHNFKIKNGLAVAGTQVIDSSLNIGAGGAADSSYDLKVHGLARFEGVANFISNFQVGGFTVITSSRNMQNIGNIDIGGYYAMDGTTLIDTSKNIINVGSITASDTIHSKGFVNYSANQDEPYLIASTSGWTGATTGWNTYGFQHRLKTNSSGVPRVTIDVATGEAFSVNNSKETHMRGKVIVAAGAHNSSSASNTDALIVGSAFMSSSAQLFVDGFSRFKGPLYLSEESTPANYIGLTYSNNRLTLTDNANGTAAIDAPDGYYVNNQQVIAADRNLTNIAGITLDGILDFTSTTSTIRNQEDNEGQIAIQVKNSSGTAREVRWDAANNANGAWRTTTNGAADLGLTNKIWNNLFVNTIKMGTTNAEVIDSSRNISAAAITATTLDTGQGAHELYAMNQNVRTTDSPTFASLNVTGDLNITGDINSVNVTDLDVVDKTITVASGAANSAAADGAGLVVGGAGAHLKWDNGDSKWAMNKSLQFDDTPTTTNQNLGIYWTGFDKEGTTDFTDTAYIRHTTNIQNFSTALEIKSNNDANDGILFTTHGDSKLKHNSNNIATETWVNAQGFLTSVTESDTLNTVTSRGNTTSNSISTGAITTTGGTIAINNANGPSFRIRKYNTTDYDNVIYYDNTTSTSGSQNRIFLGRDGDSVTIRANSNAIATFSNTIVDINKDVDLNGHVLNFQYTSGTNQDHIWHDDAGNFGRPGTFHFASDTGRKNTGNAAIIAGAYGIGTTEVITNSRNLVNIGTISSGAITSSGGLTASGTVSAPQVDYKNGSNIISAEMLSTDTLSFTGDSGQLFSITDSSSGTIFSVNDISGVPSIEVEDDGTIRLAETFGNVGIGTDNPSTKLEVVGGAMQLTNGTNGTYIKAVQTTNTANAGFFMASGSANWFNLVDTSGNYQIYDGDAAQVRLKIDGSGNVGIGTNPSSYKLEVAGTIHGNATSGAHRFVSTSSTGPIMIIKPANAQTGKHALFEYRSAEQGSANYMMVDGTSTYFATYEGALPSDESKMIRITPSNSLNPSVHIGDSGSDDAQLVIDDTIRLSGKSTTTSYINAGNFGIGTTTPTDKLEIRNNHSQLRLTDSDDNKFVQFSYSGGKLIVRNNNSGTSVNQFTLDENNRFGIGTISPSYTLDVSSGAANDARIRAFTGNSNAGAYFRAQSGLDGFYGLELYHQTTAKWFIGGYGNNRLGFYVGEKSTAANEKMSLTTAGNFGIGTTAPSTKLHLYTGGVGANTGVTDMLRIELNRNDHGAIPSGPAILFKDQDTNNLTNEARIKMMTVNDTDYGDNDEAASNLVFETTNGGTASDKMIITGRGHVGIGNINPPQLLTVGGTITVTGTTGIQVASLSRPSNAGRLELRDSGGTNRIDLNGTGDSYFNGGNLGVGTNAPAHKLHLGSAYNQTIVLDDTRTSSDAATRFESAIVWDAYYDDAARIVFEHNDYSVANRKLKFQISSTTPGSYHTGIVLQQNGNVGIGTDSPGTKLDVEAGALGGTSGNTTTAAIFRAGRQNLVLQDKRTANGTDWNNATFKIIAQVDTTNHQSIDFVNDSSYNEHIDIRTGNQVFNTRFTHDGKVGIGTTNPAQTLHVAGNAEINGSVYLDGSTTGSGGITYGTSTQQPAVWFWGEDHTSYPGQVHIIGRSDNAATNSGEISFWDYTGSTWNRNMVIRKDGKVGIGVDSPGATLHIQNTSTNSEVMRITTTGDDPDRHMYFQSDHIYSSGQLHLGDGAQRNQYRASIHQFMYGTSNAEAMRIDSSGRVGIGQDNPSAMLHIHDNAAYSSMLFRVDGQYNDVKFNGGSSGTNGVWEFENIGTWAQTRFYVQDANNDNARLTFDFRGNGGSNKILAGTSGGRVGIGTTNPLYPLQVTGSIYTNGGNVYIDSGNKLFWGNSTQWIEGNNDTNIEFGVESTVRARLVAEALQVEGGAGLRLLGGARSDAPEGTYYNWFMTGQGTDTTTWKKVCDVTITTGLYRALAMSIQARSQSGNFGSSVAVNTEEYTALFYRSAGTQDDQNNATLIGHNAHDHELRIVKTSTGNYELQAKQKTTYRDLILEIYVLSTNGGTVTIPTTGTNGSTSGTVYNITRPTNSTGHPMRALPRIQAPALNLKAADGDSTIILDDDSGRGRARFYRNNSDAYGMIYHDGTNFNFSTTAGDVLVNQDTLTLQYSESEQTNSSDSISVPSASGQQEAIQIRSPSYQDGRYTTQIAKIDRSGGLPLYFRESLGNANSYTNRMRIGTHARLHGDYVTETFGSAMFQGRLAVTSGEMLRRYEPAWSSGTPEHTVLYNSYKSALGDYTTLKTPGNSGSAHGVFVVGDNGAHFGRTNLEVGDVVANNSATAPFDSQNWGRIDATGFHSYSNFNAVHASSPTLTLQDTTNSVIFKSYAQDSNAFTGTTSNHELLIGTNNAAAMTVSTSRSVTFSNSIAVSGSISGNSSIGNLDDANDIGQQMEKGDASLTTLRFDSDRWRLYAGGSGGAAEVFSVRQDGNIGIGTNDPKGHLQSNNTAYLPFNTSGRYLTINDSDGAFLNLQSTASTQGEQIGGLMWTDTNGAGDAHKQVAQIDVYVENSGTDANDGASMRFWNKVSGAANSAPTMTLYHNRSIEIHEGTLALGTYSTTDDGILYLRGSTANKQAVIRCTNGNLHIDANAGHNTYINFYTGNSTYFGTGAGGTAAEITAAGRLYVGTGAEASPSLSFLGDTNTGFYNPTADVIGVSIAGSEVGRISGLGVDAKSGGFLINGSEVISSDKHLQNIAKFDTNLVPRTFALPNTGGSSNQWLYIGQIDSLGQHGATVSINLHSNAGYNASDSQNAEAIIRFKTSNSSSNQSGFYGDCQYYLYGQNASTLTELRVVQVNTGRFQFYGKFNNHTGVNSNYTVSHSSGTWTNGGTFSGTAPTGTQITATKRRIFTSGFAQNEDLNLGSGDVTCTILTATGAGSSIKAPLYITEQSSTGEGGEITLNGSNGNTSHTLDTVNGTFRIFESGGTFLSGNYSNGLTTTKLTTTGHAGIDVAVNASYSLYVGGHIAQSAGSIYAFGDVVIGNGELKRGTTTLINASRVMTNITLGYGATGTRFQTGGWIDSDDGKDRFYFASNSHTYYKTGGGSHIWRNSSDVSRAELDSSGNFIAEGNITAYGSASDLRIKENIEVIPDSVEKVKSLRGVTFNYKKDGKRSTGLIAQELQKVLPEAVYETKDSAEDGEDILAIRYGNVVGLLVEALKEQQTQIDNLTALVNELKEK